MNNQNQTTKYKFHVNGMHCNSCVLLTESELKELPYITHVRSSLKNTSVEIEGDFGDKTIEQIAEELTTVLKPHGYTLSLEKQKRDKNWSDFKIAIPVALLFIALFIILQKIGLVNLINTSKITYGTAFVVGIIASLSTCMAVVGGLVLSMSATFAQEGDKVKPQILFHLGRLVSFFILGGVIGALGSVFTLNTGAAFGLGIFIGIVMLIMGINLLDVFHSTKKLQLSMPKFISKRAFNISKLNHSLTPILVGIATFFLPCGFTQSMQIYTLSTGSFMNGALTMFAFALGTLPVLALISFSSFSIKNNKNSGIFFKSAGLIVILFAIMNVLNSLVVIGLIKPIFNF
ncbi:MAG: sulfite exporter TauE/SafE family protein [Candidatus Paceibacterota bacterium]